ncbi:polysaccharide biosynthesis/export family protein [Lichenicoccus sp.]|uniref:polysaccharide biosynthesis/export family protein n=1 Tax=Lichenicoccus sp. TaxID=2781899 RepID=UPI003D10A9B6
MRSLPSCKHLFSGRSLALAAILALAGCAEGADLPPLPPESSAAYHLGAGDELRVITAGEDQLSGDFHVSDAGNIAMPMLGVIKAAGMTPDQLSQEITQESESREILKNPSVSVEVVNYRPIFVLGEVNKPGQYPYQPGMTVLTAVSVAGGFTYRAVESYASVVRDVDGHSTEGKVKRQTLLQPGDVLTVFERHF